MQNITKVKILETALLTIIVVGRKRPDVSIRKIWII